MTYPSRFGKTIFGIGLNSPRPNLPEGFTFIESEVDYLLATNGNDTCYVMTKALIPIIEVDGQRCLDLENVVLLNEEG